MSFFFFYFTKDKSTVSAGMVASEASKGMGPDEESFNVLVPVTQKVNRTWFPYAQDFLVCNFICWVQHYTK